MTQIRGGILPEANHVDPHLRAAPMQCRGDRARVAAAGFLAVRHQNNDGTRVLTSRKIRAGRLAALRMRNSPPSSASLLPSRRPDCSIRRYGLVDEPAMSAPNSTARPQHSSTRTRIGIRMTHSALLPGRFMPDWMLSQLR